MSTKQNDIWLENQKEMEEEKKHKARMKALDTYKKMGWMEDEKVECRHVFIVNGHREKRCMHCDFIKKD